MSGKGTGKGAGQGTGPGTGSGAPGGRSARVRVKTAKRRTISSARWLERQLNDPYVAEAKRRGLRSRAAFKLLQLDDRFRFLKPGGRVVDLGAAPGGWTQVTVERVASSRKHAGKVVAIDILAMPPVAGATVLVGDFLAEDAPARIRAALDGPADVVLSDMAAPTTGHAKTDHLRIMALAETAFAFAAEILAPGGSFVAKLFQGGAERELLTALKRDFAEVKHVKPEASRAESAEVYVVALGFRGSRDAAAR